MKKLITFFVFVSVITSCRKNNCKLFPVNVNGKCGFISEKGEMIIEPEYETMDPVFWPNEHFSDGWLRLKKKYMFGFLTKNVFIDSCGSEQLATYFPWQDDFHDGMAKFKNSGFDNELYSKLGIGHEPEEIGFIDKTGKVIIPAKYYAASNFSEGLAYVEDKNGICGFINKKGEMMIRTEKQYGNPEFMEGLAPVHFSSVPEELKDTLFKMSQQTEGYLYLDKTGRAAIIKLFNWARNFKNGKAAAGEREGKLGVINKKGDFICHQKYSDISSFNNGLAAFLISEEDNWNIKHYGFINEKEQVIFSGIDTVIGTSYESSVEDFSEGLAAVKKHGKWGFINISGKLVIDYRFLRVGSFNGGLSWFIGEGKDTLTQEKGYIDKTGKVIWSTHDKSLIWTATDQKRLENLFRNQDSAFGTR